MRFRTTSNASAIVFSLLNFEQRERVLTAE
jgi:hypothetical protein